MEPNKEDVHIRIRYSGNSVADGTIPVDDLVSSLQGLSTLIRKVAPAGEPYDGLRLESIEAGSTVLVLGIITPAHVSAATAVASLVMTAVGIIRSAVRNRRQQKPEEPTSPESDVETSLIKLMAPLRKGDLESIEIRVEYHDQVITEKVTIEDKRLFRKRRPQYLQPPLTNDKLSKTPVVSDAAQLAGALASGRPELRVRGTINALNKSTNIGELILEDGSRIPCKLIARDVQRLYRFFAEQRALVIHGIPQFDGGQLSGINVIDIER